MTESKKVRQYTRATDGKRWYYIINLYQKAKVEYFHVGRSERDALMAWYDRLEHPDHYYPTTVFTRVVAEHVYDGDVLILRMKPEHVPSEGVPMSSLLQQSDDYQHWHELEYRSYERWARTADNLWELWSTAFARVAADGQDASGD